MKLRYLCFALFVCLLGILGTPSLVSVRAQSDSHDDGGCKVVSTNSDCPTEPSVALISLSGDSTLCLSNTFTFTASPTNAAGTNHFTTTKSCSPAGSEECASCTNTESWDPNASTIIREWWEASGPVDKTTGEGLSASFVGTNCGGGYVTFFQSWSNASPCCNSGINTIATNFMVVAVASLTPDKGTKVDDQDNDPNTDTYVIQKGCETVTVTATPCPGLAEAALPDCWNVSPKDDGSKLRYTFDTTQADVKTITATAGGSKKTVKIIIYEAKITVYADQGSRSLSDVGHGWWNLSIEPTEIKNVIALTDGDLGDDDGTAGYYDHHHVCGDGVVELGPQPNSPSGVHSPSGSHWWCISLDNYISALKYVHNLKANPGTYCVAGNNCVKQAEHVASAASAPLGFSGLYTWDLSDYLNNLPASSCPCSSSAPTP